MECIEAVGHESFVLGDILELESLDDDEFIPFLNNYFLPLTFLGKPKDMEMLHVVSFTARGIPTHPNVALIIQLVCDGILVGLGVFNSAILPCQA